MNKYKVLPILLSSFLVMTGCNNTNKSNTTVSNNKKVEYTNIKSESTKKEISKLLKDNGISDEQIKKFFDWNEDFNSRISNAKLIEEYSTEKPDTSIYKDLLVNEVVDKNGEVIPEVNCRLCSYLLIKNNVSTNKKIIKNDTFIMFDEDAINNQDKFKMTKEEKENYLTLFN